MDKLKELHNDKEMQNQWAEFILEVLDTEALKRVYKQEDTKALKEARDLIKDSFVKLNKRYAQKGEREVEDITS